MSSDDSDDVTGDFDGDQDHVGNDLLLDDGADYLRLEDNDFRSGQLYQYGRATTEEAIVADNRFVDGVTLAGDQVNWTTRGPGFQ